MPTPGATGGAMETRMPSRPIDRLWVDDTRVPRAKELIDRESRQMPTHESAVADPDFETAWQQVLTSLQSTPGSAAPSWPEEEECGFDSGGRDAGRGGHAGPPARRAPRPPGLSAGR